MSGDPHLGELTAGIVDGQVGPAERDRALVHLAHCADCRAEVEAFRRLRSRLRAAPAPEPGAELTARLLALPLDAGKATGPRVLGARVLGARVTSRRRVHAPRRTGSSVRRRRVRAGGVVVALGLGAAFALGGPSSAPSPPVDPRTDVFVADFVTSTTFTPFGDPALDASMLGTPARRPR